MVNAIDTLKKLIEEIDILKAINWREPDYEVWKGKAIRYVKKQFGDDSDYANEIKDVLNPPVLVTTDTPDSYWVNLRRETLASARAHLQGYLDELEQSTPDESKSIIGINIGPSNADIVMANLQRIFTNFHFVVKSIAKRYASRPTLEVNDEYDVQDLLLALMRIFFDDIRREEWTPSYLQKEQKWISCYLKKKSL